MQSSDDVEDDFVTLGRKLTASVEALDDPEARASGSDAASLARTRRMMLEGVSDERVAALRSDYELLGDALSSSSGSGAAAVANERRMIRKLLAVLEKPEGVAKVDELESRRAARAAGAGSAGRRRRSR